jgi:hypothetical protein
MHKGTLNNFTKGSKKVKSKIMQYDVLRNAGVLVDAFTSTTVSLR